MCRQAEKALRFALCSMLSLRSWRGSGMIAVASTSQLASAGASICKRVAVTSEALGPLRTGEGVEPLLLPLGVRDDVPERPRAGVVLRVPGPQHHAVQQVRGSPDIPKPLRHPPSRRRRCAAMHITSPCSTFGGSGCVLLLCAGLQAAGQMTFSRSPPWSHVMVDVRRHVIIETNNTTARIFPSVPDCETPEYWCVLRSGSQLAGFGGWRLRLVHHS